MLERAQHSGDVPDHVARKEHRRLKSIELEPPEDEDPQLRDPGGYKGRQVSPSVNIQSLMFTLPRPSA
jgi:hypothetical protein